MFFIFDSFKFSFLASALSLLGVAAPGHAATLSFFPVGVAVSSPQKNTSITIINEGDAPTKLQLRILRWKQVNGDEVLEPTRDVVISPPVANIPAKAKYTLRIARLVPSPVQGEESYRLLIDELPPPIDPTTGNSGIQFLMRASLPAFFVDPKAKPSVEWKVWRADGKIHVRGTNNGNRTIKLTDFSVEGPGGDTKILALGTNAYILPGSTLTYMSEAGAPDYALGTPVVVKAATGTPDAVKAQLVIASP